LTPEEAASHFRVHVNTIYRWIHEDTLRGVKVGRSWRIPKSAVQAKARIDGNPDKLTG
jgi:acetyl-CoA synthetase